MQKVILKGSDRFETKHRRKNGSVFDIEVSVQFRPEDAGQCVCFLRDITNKKKADQALRESEERYRQHFSQFPVPIFVWKRRNDRFMLTGYNEAADSITDSQVKKLIGITADQLYDDDDSAHLYETLATCYREKRTIRKEFEYRLKTTDRKKCISGSWVYVAPDTVMLHTEDITERKMAELALRESEEKFRNFTERSFVGFYIIQDGLFTYVNPKFADIFGYTVDECMDHMHFRQLVHTEDLATVQEQVRRREAGEIDTADYTFRGVKKNGEIIHVSIYGSSLIYRGRPAAIGTMLDITNALEMEERVAQSQRMEAIGSLAGGIAHDFNNILFPIIGMAELLVEDLSPGSLEHANANEIYNAGLRGRDLVKQILAFSRQSEHRMIPTRAQSVLKEVIKLSRSTIPSNIDIQEDIQPDCGFILADPTQIHQVAMNIITNAYHAVEDDGGTISIHLKETVLADTDLPDPSFEPDKPVLHLRISDTGHGIRKDHVDKIFDPYFTTKGKEKGTGLGLAVVHGIVKEHGGVIEVTSEPGKGSTFHIYLPVMEQKDAAEQTGEVEELPLGNEHILLVDDEEATAMIEMQMLERLGYTVTVRHSSTDALKAFRSKPDAFDLLITDMTMPNMTGDRLAKEIKTIRSTIPVIICTGFSEKMNPEKAEKAGISGLLMKPVGKTDMGKMVRKVLDAAKVAAVD